ncbi:MAG: hypothetical protein CL483_12870 [Acidobacteria bacterium]|nr:hypothetical protein [Acidobacteriota bacterium]|tara:strand:- start:198 stop:416 length:219 start_codon:yes stop_codon:yes gene_type:complete
MSTDVTVVQREAQFGPNPAELQPQVFAPMPVVDWIKIALRGVREQRTVLILDSNKVVAVVVLWSPKLDITEI